MNTYISGSVATTLEVEEAQFTTQDGFSTIPAFPELSPKLANLTQAWLVISLIFLTIAFGGVHPGVYLPTQMVTALIGLVVVIFGYKTFVATFFDREKRPSSALCLITLLGLVVYCTVQYLALAATRLPHPVLGTSGQVLDSASFRDSLHSIIFFIFSFVIVRSWLGDDINRAHKLSGLICALGFGISMLALSHWFYDNGKLFWTFAPDYLAITTRARWPFVNPNHLGHFLLPIAFVALGYVQRQFVLLNEKAQAAQGLKDRGVTRIMTNHRFQRQLIWLMFSCIGLFAMAIALAATLSRGTWLGCSVGLVVLALLTTSAKSTTSQKPKPAPRNGKANFEDNQNNGYRDNEYKANEYKESAKRSRRRRRSRDEDSGGPTINLEKTGTLLRRYARPIIVLLSVVLFVFFLQGRGTDLLTDRIEYGLMYSKDDLRWQMYADTLPMIRDYLFFGVGLGGWLQAYGPYASPAMSGLNPVYLHNDPEQFLSELGILGSLPIILLILGLGRLAITKRATLPPEIAQRLTFRFCGLTGLLVASFLDFPFHIPAIQLSVAVLFALTVFDIESPDPI